MLRTTEPEGISIGMHGSPVPAFPADCRPLGKQPSGEQVHEPVVSAKTITDTALGIHVRDKAELRRMIFNLSIILRKLKCTSLLVSEIVHGKPGLSRYGVEEFVADSVVVLYYERLQSTFSRAIQVWKVRGSSHSEKLHPYKIDQAGVTVYPKEEAFIKR